MAPTGNPKRLRAVYYRASDGREPVSDFIDALPVKQQVVLDNQIDRINELCTTAQPDLPFRIARRWTGSCGNFAATTGGPSIASSTGAPATS